MCWQCDHPGATADDYLDELRETMLEQRMGGAVRRKRPNPIRIHRSGCTTAGCPNCS